MSKEILEWRGAKDLVAAEVTCDDNETGYETGTPFDIAGLAEIAKTVSQNTEVKYYDDSPAMVIDSEGSDTLTFQVSAIPLDILARITGQKYNSELGAFIEGSRELKYFAVGYKTKKTNGDPVYVWRYKGTFAIPDVTNSTETDGTESNGQTLVYTGVKTTHKFANVLTRYGEPDGAKSMAIDVAKGLADVSAFFEAVTTPDTIEGAGSTYRVTNALTKCRTSNSATSVSASEAYTATVTADTGYTLDTVKVFMGGEDISSTAVSGGSISIASVSGDVVVIATAVTNS